MLRYMLDTNLCIRVLRDRPAGLRERFNAEAANLCISTVTLAELLVGAEKSSRPIEIRQQVEAFAARLDVLSFDSHAAAHYADIRADLERKGQTIGPYDLMIAGHARSRGLMVITGNLDEFNRVAGLRAEDWLAALTPPAGRPRRDRRRGT
ncbi:tRNA(fMet)-specific endonuclease VapC [Magnetospirillum sp. 15-1]|uniref:type II toxin-antitoxin system tRNA(fMet)-specific endonuclease VapC n=1 Tax=Magnetospirillum sp. 15-1 TaxID=1979370 RepID=UPI000BBB9D5E|nr:tRNA(fMet)-specific endonuclease VapC [Magnetospirillum sp. 15-1]